MTGRDNEEMRVLHGNVETTDTRQTETALHLDERAGTIGATTAGTTTTQLGGAGEVGRLQLLEERAQVQVLRQGVGQVQIRKVLRERQEMVPVPVTTEVLEIVVRDLSAAGASGQPVAQAGESVMDQGMVGQGVSQILLDGKPLEVGRTYEIPLTEERVQVLKQVYPISEVVIRKQAQTTTHQETVTLRHEELDVVDEQRLARLVDSVAGDETGHR